MMMMNDDDDVLIPCFQTLIILGITYCSLLWLNLFF